MPLSFSQRLLSLCLAFGLLFVSSPLCLAESPLDLYSEELLIEGIPVGSDDNTGLFLYVNGENVGSSVSTLGTIQDNSNATRFELAVYNTNFNWRTDEVFTPSSSIGYTKLFTLNQLSSFFSGKTISSADSYNTAVGDFFGYTLKIVYEDEVSGTEVLPKGSKITLDLNLPAKLYSGQSYFFDSYFYNSSFNTSYSSSSHQFQLSSSYDKTPMSDVSSSMYLNPNCSVLFTPTLTVSGVNSDGDFVTIGTYSDDSVSTVFTLTDDLSDLTIDVFYTLNSTQRNFSNSSSYNHVYGYPAMITVDVSGTISIDTSGQSIGLLKGIIEWLRNILNAITSLPGQIASLVIDGVKSLFVPSADSISSKFADFKSVAEDKLGFLYTIFDMVYSLFESIKNGVTQPMETLTIPAFSLPFSYVDGGQIVVWQDMTFDIMPSGLDVLKNLCKLLTSLVLITATISFCVDYLREFFKKE